MTTLSLKMDPAITTTEKIFSVVPLIVAVALLVAMFAAPAFAQAMPWEGPICKVATSLSGPVARYVAIIAIVVCGLLLALGEVSGIFKTMLGLLAGLSMALLASQWLGFISSAATAVGGCS